MSWVFLALMATFLWACANVFDKILRTKFLKSSLALTAAFGISGTIFGVIMLLFFGIGAMPLKYFLASFIAGLALTIAIILYVKSLSLEEASRVVPLWHLSAAFTLILAFIFLNEVLGILDYVAFALILLGGVLISTKFGIRINFSPAFLFMMLSSILIAVSDVLLKFAYSYPEFWQVFTVFYLAGSCGSLSLFAFSKVRKNFFKSFAMHRIKLVGLLLASFLFGSLGYILYSKAIVSGPVTLVSVFVSFQSLFVLLIATALSIKFPIFLKEAIDAKTIGIKLASIALMAFGLFLLSFY